MDIASRAAYVHGLQRRVGNRATARDLARQPTPQTSGHKPTLREQVEQARRTDPAGYVMRAVTGMAQGNWSVSERTVEIVWRMIWMFLADQINTTLVQADPGARGVEQSPNPLRGYKELVIGPDFINGITTTNLPDRVMILRLVLEGRQAIIARLQTDFGFAAVDESGATWTAGELAETYVGLSKMPQADRRALSGVTLRRVATIVEHGQQFDGEFAWDVAAVAQGSTTAPDLTQVLRLADGAFTDPDRAAWVVVHEAGHAVDSDVRRHARLAAGHAIATENVRINDLNNASTAATTAFNAAIGRANQYALAARSVANAFISSVRTAHNAINAFSFGGGNAAAAEQAADRAIAARDSARNTLTTAHPTNPADSDFSATCTAQDDWMVAARVAAAARAATAQARTDVSAASGAQRGHANMSRRLEAFLTVVNTNNIAPITPYAQQNWPAHPEEFFAEAYSMWRNNPTQLPQPLRDFFDNGGHQQ